ncbi:MAG: dienelactone hydrolase family protein [Terriglobales bacterium]
MPNLLHDKVTLKISDGSKMDCYVARLRDGDAQRPGLIVLQEAFGVNEHIRDVTERFGRQGFVAIAPELYHRTAPGIEIPYTDFAAAMPHIKALTRERIDADLRATFEWLQAQPFVKADEISCVGFCMGGRVAFAANTILPLKTAVSYYATGLSEGSLDRVASLHGPHLFYWGGKDKHIPPEQRATVINALKERGKTYVNVEFSDADHGFFCDVRPAYNPTAARQSWALTLEFLRS